MNNLENMKQQLRQVLDDLNVTFSYSNEKNGFRARANSVSLGGRDDEIAIIITCFDNYAIVEFVFEKLAFSESNYCLINRINQTNLFLIATILQETGHLSLYRAFSIRRDEDLAEEVKVILKCVSKMSDDADLLELRKRMTR